MRTDEIDSHDPCAMRPLVGTLWVREPETAPALVRVTAVQWDGEEWRVGVRPLQADDETWNDLSQFWETCHYIPNHAGPPGTRSEWVWTVARRGTPKADENRAVTAARVRVSMVVSDILDAIDSAPPDDPAWGLRLCEQTGYGTGTVYPALDRLMKAEWISDRWEEPQPADRPRRRFYALTEDGRGAWQKTLAARKARRSAWTR